MIQIGGACVETDQEPSFLFVLGHLAPIIHNPSDPHSPQEHKVIALLPNPSHPPSLLISPCQGTEAKSLQEEEDSKQGFLQNEQVWPHLNVSLGDMLLCALSPHPPRIFSIPWGLTLPPCRPDLPLDLVAEGQSVSYRYRGPPSTVSRTQA